MSTIPNFADVPFAANASPPGRADSTPDYDKSLTWLTPEQIPVRPLYTAADLAVVDHLDTMPGMPPFLRGTFSGPGPCVNTPAFPPRKIPTRFIAAISRPGRWA
jgi:hypothetical protein